MKPGRLKKGEKLLEFAPPGLHSYLLEKIIPRYFSKPGRMVDLGAGSGGFVLSLKERGWEVLGVDRTDELWQVDLPHLLLDMNDPSFSTQLPSRGYDLVTAIEVIEHLESPLSFLRNISNLLSPTGFAILTTPNVENLPGRFRFFLEGTLRSFNDRGEETHITPIVLYLFLRRYLPLVGLTLAGYHPYPPRGTLLSRPLFRPFLNLLMAFSFSSHLRGDSHILVLQHLPS